MLSRENYKIFVWDSRDTGHYLQKFYQNILTVRNYAKTWAGKHYTIEGENGYFEEYKNGEKISYSAPNY